MQICIEQMKEGRGFHGSEESRESAWDSASSPNFLLEHNVLLPFHSCGFPSTFKHLVLVIISQAIFPEQSVLRTLNTTLSQSSPRAF